MQNCIFHIWDYIQSVSLTRVNKSYSGYIILLFGSVVLIKTVLCSFTEKYLKKYKTHLLLESKAWKHILNKDRRWTRDSRCSGAIRPKMLKTHQTEKWTSIIKALMELNWNCTWGESIKPLGSLLHCINVNSFLLYWFLPHGDPYGSMSYAWVENGKKRWWSSVQAPYDARAEEVTPSISCPCERLVDWCLS